MCGRGGGGAATAKGQAVSFDQGDGGWGGDVFQPQNKFGYKRFSGSEDNSFLDNARTLRNMDI